MKKKLLQITLLAIAIIFAYNNCARKDGPGTLVDKVLQSTQTGNPNDAFPDFPKLVCQSLHACSSPVPSDCTQQLSQNAPFYNAFRVQNLHDVYNFLQLNQAVQQNLVSIHLPKANDCAQEIQENICHNEYIWEVGNYDSLAFLVPERSACQGVFVSNDSEESPPMTVSPYGRK